MQRRRLLPFLVLLVAFGLVAAACSDESTPDTVASGDTAAAPDTAPPDTAAPDTAPADTTPADTTPADDMGYSVRHVGVDYDTIQAAVDDAEPGDLVLIDPGVYHEAVVVQTDNLVIRGMDRNTVILDGEFADGFENGIIIFSNGVAVENLTVRNYTGNGLFWTGDYGTDVIVDGYRASYVTTHNIGVYGIYAFNAENGQIDHAYAGASDDSGYYVGQCDPCNALLYKVEGANSQLGYSGTNSTGVTVADSWFHDNMIGVVPNSQDGEELAPNAGTVIVGNLIENNNSMDAPSRNKGFQTGLGTGVILAGVENNVVERNTIVNNTRAGVIVLDWVADILGGSTDYDARNNIVRDNVISGSTLDADLLMALNDVSEGGRGNCFSGNEYGASNPADIETVLGCGGDDTAELVDLGQLLDQFNLAPFEPPKVPDVPAPELNFEVMPGDPAADAPMPAVDVPMDIDLDSLQPPTPSS